MCFLIIMSISYIYERKMNIIISSKNRKDDDYDEQILLPGFRFHPTDEELVGFYLKRKVENRTLNIDLIKVLDIYKFDPWDLPKMSGVGDKEWYFFCIRGRKYRNSIRPNRVTGSGFWKATGIDKPISHITNINHCIGLKKSLVYYKGSAGKGLKTDWMMHEFRLPPSSDGTPCNLHSLKTIPQEAEVWTLCRIFKRISPYKKYIPDLKETIIKPKSVDSNLKSCSLESDITEQCASFGESVASVQQNQKNQYVVDHHLNNSSSSPTPFSSNFSSFWYPNHNGDDFFRDGNWDELRSVVEFAVDSSTI